MYNYRIVCIFVGNWRKKNKTNKNRKSTASDLNICGIDSQNLYPPRSLHSLKGYTV